MPGFVVTSSTAGRIACSVAFACSSVTPSRRRPMMCSHALVVDGQRARVLDRRQRDRDVRRQPGSDAEESARGDADDREGLALDTDALADDVAAAAEAAHPARVADHRDQSTRAATDAGRRRRRRCGPAAGCDAERRVEVAGRRQDLGRFKSAGPVDVDRLEVPGEHVGEDRRSLGRGRPDRSDTRTLDSPIHARRSGARTGSGSSTRALIRPKTLVVAPMPSAVTRMSGGGESRAPLHRSQRIRRVLAQMIEPRPDPDGARVLLRERDVAERAPAGRTRLARRHPGALELFLPSSPDASRSLPRDRASHGRE